MPSPLKSLKSATLSLLSLTAVTAAGAAQADAPPLLFPIAQGARWSDTFGAPRVGHSHQGADLMAPKMRPLVACFAGTVTIRRGRGTAGNWITLSGSGGWRAEYMHINNDTPGTNDGLGGDRYAFAPGLQSGDFVQAGQFLGYVGNSGNAESTGSHCHFELHGPGGVINPATVLRAARILPSPQIGSVVLPPAPAPKPEGPLRVSGTVLSYAPDQGEAVIRVTSITEFGGSPVTLSPPRIKQVNVSGMLSLPALTVGSAITAEGRDGGRGLPLQATRVTTARVQSVAVSSLGTVRGSTTAYRGLRAISEPLPERLMLDGFERATYQNWYLEGDCWGRGPETVYGSRRIPGAGGRGFLSTAHAQIGSGHAVSGTGRAVSPPFSVTHSRLRFLIGGGSFPGECSLNLLVDGKVVRSETGSGSDRLLPVEWEIGEFLGKRARLEIIDTRRFGERAYVLLDQIELEGLAPVPAGMERDPAPTAISASPPVPAPTASRSPQIPQIRQKAVQPRATVLLPDGTRLEGARLMTLEATGYGPADNGPWGDRTALGTKVGYATVAVDPKVIPLRTRLWVEGYGFCVALDTGGAIKGNRIDLGHDNQSDAIRVGRKKLRVLVLD